MNLILIAFGGAFGSVLRHICSDLVMKIIRHTPYAFFPLNTLFVNVFGSMLAGIFYYFSTEYFNYFDPKIRLFIFTGFLGGFTTFSAFSLDFFRLFAANQYLSAATYVLASLFLSIIFLFFGFYLMKTIC